MKMGPEQRFSLNSRPQSGDATVVKMRLEENEGRHRRAIRDLTEAHESAVKALKPQNPEQLVVRGDGNAMWQTLKPRPLTRCLC